MNVLYTFSYKGLPVPPGTALSISFLMPLPTIILTSSVVCSAMPNARMAWLVLAVRSSRVYSRVPSRSNMYVSNCFISLLVFYLYGVCRTLGLRAAKLHQNIDNRQACAVFLMFRYPDAGKTVTICALKVGCCFI